MHMHTPWKVPHRSSSVFRMFVVATGARSVDTRALGVEDGALVSCSALQLGTLRYSYLLFVRTFCWISDRRIPLGLESTGCLTLQLGVSEGTRILCFSFPRFKSGRGTVSAAGA